MDTRDGEEAKHPNIITQAATEGVRAENLGEIRLGFESMVHIEKN